MNKHVMEGFRVLDFTQVIAEPTTTRLMAEMGAEIIKIELGPHRRYHPLTTFQQSWKRH